MNPSSFLSTYRPVIKICVKLLLPALLWLHTASAQSKRELEQRKDRLQKEINEANKELERLTKSKTATLAQIETIKKKIRARTELINTISAEINLLDNEINQTGQTISSLEEQMKKLKEDYASMIVYAQRNNNRYQRLHFVLAANDFNQAYKRIAFLQQINRYRRQQAANIDSTQAELNRKKTALENQRAEKNKLRTNELRQKAQLDSEKKQQDKLVGTIQEREKKLKAELVEKQKAKQKLERAIADIIRKEIEAAKKKAAATTGSKKVTAENAFTLTPEAQKLSSTFAGSRGSLPWPVEKGTISSRFGKHAHPELKGVVVNNDGIDIKTEKGAAARAVFNGEVTGIVDIPGSGSAIIIRHGEYLTVYSNLQSTLVKKGDKITTRQTIGLTGSGDDQAALLNFQIWKGFTKLDPEQWLARR
jgi:septal ring factor EnvC (AmiA/AmiB activator)